MDGRRCDASTAINPATRALLIKSMVPIHTLLFTLTALRPTPIFATTTTTPRASILQKMPTPKTVARRLGMLQISTDNLFERAE